MPISVFRPNVTVIGGTSWDRELYDGALAGMSPSDLWRSQPHLRTVVSFRANQTSQLGLHVFRRASDTDRVRDHDSPLAQLVRRPNGMMTWSEMIFALVGDLDLHDRAHWLLTYDQYGAPQLTRMPPAWVSAVSKDQMSVDSWRVTRPDGRVVKVPADSMLSFGGFTPDSLLAGSPPLETLRDTLEESMQATRHRRQTWTRGGRVSSIIKRPADAPRWTDQQRESFRQDWYAKYTGNGSMAGGTPILDDGMTLERIDFSARDTQYVDGVKLSLQTVCQVYHVNPVMVGQLDNANYSNAREFRSALYTDTLGPLLKRIEDRINTFLLPMLDMDPRTHYAEFNIREKLRGNFEEETAALSSSVGAPFMTRNEARARQNLPAISDGDELITPLNVLVGGQASPRDSAPPKKRKVLVKAIEAEPETEPNDEYADELSAFFGRQGASVAAKWGAGTDWWDQERWDRELSGLLESANLDAAAAAALTVTGDDDRREVMAEFIATVAATSAGYINETTRGLVAEAETSDDVSGVFASASETRAGEIAAHESQFAAHFGVVDAAKDIGGATKTWVTTSRNPRKAHKRMDGETVPINEEFSNGLRWPGDRSGDADDTAGCKCTMKISVPEGDDE